MRICISGTPGTGKSVVAKMISENYIELNIFSKINGFIKGIDKKRNVGIVDIDCLKSKLKDIDDAILVGHYSHLLSCDIVIVLRTNPQVLEKRLRERNYSQEKLRENLEAEALGIITEEALSVCKNVYEIDTSDITIEETAKIINKIIEGKGEEYRAGKINFMEEILKWY